MITTIEELEALPDGSVIKSRNDWVFVKDSPGWWSFGFESYPAEEVADVLPAKLLIPNTISQGQFREAFIAARDSQSERTGVCSGIFEADLEATLKTLGIEVSDV